MDYRPLLVAVTGPECSGKTTLSKKIALALGGVYVAEYARAYLAGKPHGYEAHDLTEIARGQAGALMSGIAEAGEAPCPIVVADTDLTVIRIWSEEKFGRTDPLILRLQQAESFDLTLLCDPAGVPWEPDPLRENPHDRDRLFTRYLQHYRAGSERFAIISGEQEERLRSALDATRRLMSVRHETMRGRK